MFDHKFGKFLNFERVYLVFMEFGITYYSNRKLKESIMKYPKYIQRIDEIWKLISSLLSSIKSNTFIPENASNL